MKLIGQATLALSLSMAGAATATVTVSDDPVLFWNEQVTTLMVAGPPAQTRAYAMMNIAMFDAANSAIGGAYQYYTSGVTGFGGDVRAAVSQAAFSILSVVDAANAATYQTRLAESLALVTNSAERDLGIETGMAYANAVLAMRSADGSTAQVTYTPSGQPGNYVTTSPGTAGAPQWGGVTPFIMTSPDQFRSAPPPALTSSEYAAAYNEVKEVGAQNSATRTQDQTAAALFWDAANGAPWMRIGLTIAEDEGLSTLDNARAFALLSSSLADALIAGFDTKYEYRLWRPITAIHEGDGDGNPLTEADAGWNSLFPAPNHPSYMSTHSALSGAGESILTALFGDDEAFSLTIAGDTRNFTGLHQAAQDGSDSRLWGGIHFRFDNEAGLKAGRQIGALALSSGLFSAAVPEPATWALMISGFAMAGGFMRRQNSASHGRVRLLMVQPELTGDSLRPRSTKRRDTEDRRDIPSTSFRAVCKSPPAGW